MIVLLLKLFKDASGDYHNINIPPAEFSIYLQLIINIL